jgi:cytochrome c oxidase subunit 2
MAIAIAIFLLVIGSILFHFLSPWYFTPSASNWGTIDATVNITFWVTGIVFVAVNLFMVYAIIRYRHREGSGRRADYEPENKKLEGWLTVITTIGVAAMLAPGLLLWADFVTVPDDAMVVETVGQQWHFSHRFPGKDGKLGTVDARLINPDNAFGIDPKDPDGQDDVLIFSPEMHLPIGQPVRLLLRSKDVLHDFAVPQFRVKMDFVPGMVTFLWFEPSRTGTFDILCEEFCGLGHFAMRGSVVVEAEDEFNSWLDAQPTFAEMVAMPAGDAAVGQALYATCAACHGSQGEGNQELKAPKLSGQDSWYLARQLKNYKERIRGSHEDDINGQQMAAMAATLVDEMAIKNVVAYIKTLPDEPAPATIVGNKETGKKLYTTCAACHGKNGQGIWALNAPRQAGMSDWYLAEQLRNFRVGIRGAHDQDAYGEQMALMAQSLSGDRAINDLMAYINTLPDLRHLTAKPRENKANTF